MDTIVEHSENTTLGDQIKIVNDLEKYVFEKIRSTPPFNFNKSIRMATDFETLKTIINTLHDEGLFRESDKEREKRLCTEHVQVPIPSNGNNQAEKLDFEYLPKHYHEIIQGIKIYRSAIETKNHEQAQDLYKILLREVANHSIGYIPELLPESLQGSIKQIKNSYLSQEPDEIKEKVYIDFVEEFIKKYEYDHVLLWNTLNFSRQEQNTLKELSFFSFRFIGPFKNKYAIRKHNSKINTLTPKKIILFEQLMEYLNKRAELYVRYTLKQIYTQKEKSYKKLHYKIDKLLRSELKKYQTEILNKQQQVKVFAKIRTKFTPKILEVLRYKRDSRKFNFDDLQEYIKEEKRRQLKFNMLLQKHIVQNLTNSSLSTISSEPIYDPFLFAPTTSIHNSHELSELKEKVIRNQSNKKQSAFKLKIPKTSKAKRSFIGDTERMLKDNKKIYQSLKDLLND